MESEYNRMERAIRYIEDHAEDQPSLDVVSEHVGLSPYHFQRVFKKWTGLSPKRYLQFLTVENAKMLLDRSASVLDTTYDIGLSSPGRLHDLFVSVEAVTPGQYKSGGAGLDLVYGSHETPFGHALLAMKGEGITDLMFADEEDGNNAIAELERKWPSARITEAPDETGVVLEGIFGRDFEKARGEPKKLCLRGTNFQLKVWNALLNIPEGLVVSYTDVAKMVDRPDAVRAVANAVGRNPVAWIIPCHRVLRSSGEMGGYRWGITRKKIMLARELGEEL